MSAKVVESEKTTQPKKRQKSTRVRPAVFNDPVIKSVPLEPRMIKRLNSYLAGFKQRHGTEVTPRIGMGLLLRLALDHFGQVKVNFRKIPSAGPTMTTTSYLIDKDVARELKQFCTRHESQFMVPIIHALLNEALDLLLSEQDTAIEHELLINT